MTSLLCCWPPRLPSGARAAIGRLAGLVGLSLTAAALARAPLALCVGAALVLVGGLGLLLHPALGVYLLAFSIPFGSLREFSLGGLRVGASEVLVGGMIAAWLARMLATRRVTVLRSRLGLALAFYLVLLLVLALRAGQLTPAIKELAKWSEVLLLYLFVSSALEASERRRVVIALLAAGVTQSGLGIYQFLRQVGPPGFVLFGRFMRAHGTFLQPNPYGGYLGLLLPFAYVTALANWSRRANAPPGGRAGSLAAFFGATLSTGLMTAALLMSWSRGALLGLLGGALLVAVAWSGKSRLLLIVAVILVALVGSELVSALPGGLASRLTDLAYLGQDLTAIEITDDNFAIIERLAHWQAAWRMFAQRPWLGVGLGQYAVVYPSVAIPRWGDPLGHAHNYYLHVLAEGGLCGLAGYTLVLLVALGSVWRRARSTAGWDRALALSALGVLGHLIGHSLVDNLFVHEMYLLIAIALGLALGGKGAPADASSAPCQDAQG